MSILLVPRWAGTPDSDWYPWLRGELDAPITTAHLLPRPDAPTIAAMVEQLAALAPPDTLADTLLVGHSVGCQALIRYVASLPEGTSVRGLVAIAGWFELDSAWPPIVPWIDTPIDTGRVRDALGFAHLVLSDNDPYTGDHRANARQWRERLGAEVTLIPGGAHFNGGREEAVLTAVQQALAR